MKKNNFIFTILALCSIINFNVNAQNIAITDDDTYNANSSAMLDVKSISKGLLIPRLTSTQRNGISAPATGLLVFDTTLGGFYYYNGTSWINITSGISSNLWSFDGVNKAYLTNTNNRLGVGTNSPSAKMVVKGDATMGVDQPLFSVVNKNNDTIFAVYDGGVRIYVDDSPAKTSGSKGGFAVGGFSPAKGISANEYLRVTPDSVRIYVEDLPVAKTSGSKGGFAVGGFSPAKSIPYNLLTLNGDSASVFIGDSTAGFGINNIQGGSNDRLLNLTTQNYFIGHKSGKSNTVGGNNTFFGYNAGEKNESGSRNIFVGNQSGQFNISGYENVMIGNRTGYKNTNGYNNTFLGNLCGYNNTSGFNNIFIGNKAGYGNTGGIVEEGSFNTYIGFESGYYGTKAGSNTFLGYQTGYLNDNGLHNTFIGRWAGYSTTGSYNVFLGTEAGRFVGDKSYRLHINASNTPGYVKPLIYGEFDNKRVVIAGDESDNINNRTFFVRGQAGGLFPWFNDSDKRLKKNIITIDNALDKVLKLRGVNYEWIDNDKYGKGLQMGFIAQEADDIIPEVIDKSNDHYSMTYAPITALLVEAIKEQQRIIENLKKDNTELKAEVEKIQSLQKQLNIINSILEVKVENNNK